MSRLTKKPRNHRCRNRPETKQPRFQRNFPDEATSIYVKSLPASADKQSLHDWCQRTIFTNLHADGQQGHCEGIIDNIWIAKPVAIKSDPGDDGKTQKLRYAHIRFKHEGFKRLMMALHKPEEFDGISKPEIQRWKPKAARHKETNPGHRDGDLGRKATITSSKEMTTPSSEAVGCAAERAVEQ